MPKNPKSSLYFGNLTLIISDIWGRINSKPIAIVKLIIEKRSNGDERKVGQIVENLLS